MKKERFKKFLAGTAMGLCALAMPFGLVGCDTEQNIDLRVQDGYVQWQVEGKEEWDNLFTVEELKTLTSQDIETLTAEELRSLLGEYFTSIAEKEMTYDEIKAAVLADYFTLAELSLTQNYTYTDGTNYSRVEYVSDELTKVYHYALNDDNEKIMEIYREITNDTVTTYVKDLNMYSVVPIYKTRDANSVLTFDDSSDIALKGEEEYVTWSTVFSTANEFGKIWYDADAPKFFVNTISSMQQVPVENLANSMIELEISNGKKIYKTKNVYYSKGDEHDYQGSGVINATIEITENSIKEISNLKEIWEKPASKYDRTYYSLYEFDKVNTNTIDFDKTGYVLVSDYYASLQE